MVLLLLLLLREGGCSRKQHCCCCEGCCCGRCGSNCACLPKGREGLLLRVCMAFACMAVPLTADYSE